VVLPAQTILSATLFFEVCLLPDPEDFGLAIRRSIRIAIVFAQGEPGDALFG